jgi:type VI protein secretion system component Hcp
MESLIKLGIHTESEASLSGGQEVHRVSLGKVKIEHYLNFNFPGLQMMANANRHLEMLLTLCEIQISIVKA